MIFNNTTTEVPDELLALHEEGKVVFFCGAGISAGAGLPLYRDLVVKTARRARLDITKEEQALVDEGLYDMFYAQLERRHANPFKLREISARLLKPKKNINPNAYAVHKHLLSLSRVRKTGELHLVTTNYDTLFVRAAKALKVEMPEYVAPLLPIPKTGKWNGLVYLHGKLSFPLLRESLNSFVISSGDFGQAYLTERWAARFISELFRMYTVCFIGYSANDTIMKYVVDALASDVRSGNRKLKVYAFDGYTDGEKEDKAKLWEMRGVEPILFFKPERNDYSELGRAIEAWNCVYSLGLSGAQRIIVDEAAKLPADVTSADRDSIRRVIWALRQEDGLAAAQFGQMEPPPPLEWFDEFLADDRRIELEWQKELSVDEDAVPEDDPLLPLSKEGEFSQRDLNILIWLGKYLADVGFLRRLLSYSPQISNRVIGYFIDELQENNPFRGEVPDADVPFVRSLLTLWFESNRHWWGQSLERSLHSAFEMVKRDRKYQAEFGRLVATLTLPVLNLQYNDLAAYGIHGATDIAERFRREFSRRYGLVGYDFGFYRSVGTELKASDFPLELFHVLESNLQLACEMRRTLGDEIENTDMSEFVVPDVRMATNPDSHNGDGWTNLAIMLRLCWENVLSNDIMQAKRYAMAWLHSEHPIFNRLALYAATCKDAIPADEVVAWLLAASSERLLSGCYRREFLCFLRLCGQKISPLMISKLLALYDKNISDVADARLLVRHRAYTIDALMDSGATLSKKAICLWGEFDKQYPDWKNRNKSHDGLAFYVCDAENDDCHIDKVDLPPMPTDDVGKCAEWFARRKAIIDADGYPDRDPWREMCKNDISAALALLIETDSISGSITPYAWHDFMMAAASKEHATIVWDKILSLKEWKLPDYVIKEDGTTFSAWFREVGVAPKDVGAYIALAERFLSCSTEKCSVECQVVVEGVIKNWYYLEKPACGSLVRAPYREFFTKIARATTEPIIGARRALFRQLGHLTLIDREWTFTNLTVLLKWGKEEDKSVSAWREAVCTSSFNNALMGHIKSLFVKAASKYVGLGKYGINYVDLLLCMALSRLKSYSAADYQKIIRALPDVGRIELSGRIKDRLLWAGDKRDSHWREEIRPFIEKCWPSDAECMNAQIAGNLFSSIVYCQEEFPMAIRYLCQKVTGKAHLEDAIIRLLHPEKGKTSHFVSYPDSIALLLEKFELRDIENYGTRMYLKECLKELANNAPNDILNRHKNIIEKLQALLKKYRM